MSTGQKIRKLAIKIDELNKEFKDLQNQHLENKKECNCEKSWPADFDNKHDRYKGEIDKGREKYELDITPELNSFDNIETNYIAEHIDNLIEIKNQKYEKEIEISYQTCENLKNKIKQLEKERDDYKFAAEINYKKFEALNKELKEKELIVRANKDLLHELELEKQHKNIKINDEIIVWLKNLSEGKYDNYKVNIYEKENAKKLLQQLGINNE
jgi:hypothetical protein